MPARARLGEDHPGGTLGVGILESLGSSPSGGAPSGAAAAGRNTAPGSSTAAAAVAAEAAADAGGGAYLDLLAWAYSPDSKVTREDLDVVFLEAFLACPIAAQRVGLGYLQGRVQQGMFSGISVSRRPIVMEQALQNVARRVSGPPPFEQLEALFSAPIPGHPTAWHKADVGSEAIESFLACQEDVQHMVLQVTLLMVPFCTRLSLSCGLITGWATLLYAQ